jgi:DNA-binding NtrC family response regulator
MMIEAIKTRLWRVLENKAVSLAMIYDRDGRILWHCGRSISGRTIDAATGFPKSLIGESITEGRGMEREDVVLMCSGDGLPQSARVLYLRSLLILAIEASHFLYLDSGTKESFSTADIEVFRVMGELLGESIARIRGGGNEPDAFGGSSRAARETWELIARYAVEEDPVLLLGETGAGKNVVAGLIHRYSGRRGKLVVVPTPNIQETLFESELFGHARNAFTGAEAKKGLVTEAEGGSLLLDEISEVPGTLQAKLLAFVETKRYRVLGETKEREADVRILAATNRDIACEVREKRFRSDLYYRLNVLPVEIPPLRERKEDIRDIVSQNLELLRGKRPTEAFWAALEAYPWPGNVRELLHVLTRAGILLPGPELGSEIRGLLRGDLLVESPEVESPTAGIAEAIRQGASFWDAGWNAFLDRDINRSQLRSMLQGFFNEASHNLKRTAAALNLPEEDYNRFVSALHKYNVHPAGE